MKDVCFFKVKNLEFWFNPNDCYEYIQIISQNGRKKQLTSPKEDAYYGSVFKFINIKPEINNELIFIQALGAPNINFIYSLQKNLFLRNPYFGHSGFGQGHHQDKDFLEIQSGCHIDFEVKYRLNILNHEFEKHF